MHGARFAMSVDEMLADDAVQVVVIGSSTDVHETHLLASVRAGKAVLCEKPHRGQPRRGEALPRRGARSPA